MDPVKLGYLIEQDDQEARRDAEAGVAAAVEQLAEEYEQTLRDRYEGPLTGIEAGPDAVHPKPPREGPGSAAAHLKLRDIAPNETVRAVIDKMASEGAVLIPDKPAPAADDLVRRLRGRACGSWEVCDEAADRIEAETARAERAEAENARLRDALLDARDMVQSWGAYASDYFKDKWDFAGDIAKLNAALARGGDQ